MVVEFLVILREVEHFNSATGVARSVSTISDTTGAESRVTG